MCHLPMLKKLTPLALLLAMLPKTAAAATVTDTFTVSATVLSACTVSATDLAFGTYVPTDASPVDGTSTITVNCSLLAPYSVGLNAGLHGGGDVTARKMEGPLVTDLLNYNLYSDATRLLNWGNTLLTGWVTGVGTGSDQALTVYGRIPASQSVNEGAYTDTITVTITY